MENLLLIVIVVVFVIVSIKYESSQKRKKIEQAFEGRPCLNNQEMYERYFQSQNIPSDVVFRVKRILEEQLDADLSRLTEEDDFSTNLSFFWDFDSMADVEIVMALEEEFDIKIEDSEAEHTSTILDIMNLVDTKKQKHAGNSSQNNEI